MSPPFKIHKILVVDDDPVQNKLLESRLAQNGYSVQVANDAPDGLQTAMSTHPHCVILDVMMPIINGYNFCRILKNEMNRKDLGIILLTSRDKLEDIQIGMDMGADAYLIKPVNIDELLRTIKVVENNHRKH